MKSIRVAALTVAAAFAVALPASAVAAPTLERGDKGRSVKRLQRTLHVHADGVFGPGTVRAVKRFQRRHGLKPDGIVGAGTWRALRASAAPRVARRGPSVRILQRRLGIAPDGVYGPQTSAAVKAFQRNRGLTADGLVGPATWRALGISPNRPVLKPARLGGTGSSRSSSRGMPRAVRLAIRAANHINSMPYRYGGGHGRWDDTGYDCSGTISYVLHGAGLVGRSRDSGEYMRWGAPGRGRWITIYANHGHAFMVIAGRRYDTSGANPGRWQSDMPSTAGYVVRHPPGL